MSPDFYATPRFLPCGDGALTVEFGRAIDLSLNNKVQALFRYLRGTPFPGLVDLIPSYRSLLVQYDPLVVSWAGATAALRQVLTEVLDSPREETSAMVEIPVCYGGVYGPDLPEVASCLGLTPEEVVAIHSNAAYHIYMIGFTPGFPFLGGLDPRLHIPRKKTPRERVPAGSVGLAGQQTGIYPMDSPGGWQLIGRTPLKLFDYERPDPVYLKAGQTIRFRPIAAEEFADHQNH